MPGRHEKGSPPTDEDFTGHVKDNSTGLHYAGARYYSAAFGRWTTTEPLLHSKGPKGFLKQDPRLLSMTSYNYALNNPVLYDDPTGKCVWDGCVLEAIVIGAAVGGGAELAIQSATSGPVDYSDVGISAAFGGITGGAGNYANAVRGAGRATQLAIGALGSAAEGKAKAEANGNDYSQGDAIIDAGLGIFGSGTLIGAKEGGDSALSSARKTAEEALSESRDASIRASDAIWDAVLGGQTSKKTARELFKKAQKASQEASGQAQKLGFIRRLRSFQLSQWVGSATGATVGGSAGSTIREEKKEEE